MYHIQVVETLIGGFAIFVKRLLPSNFKDIQDMIWGMETKGDFLAVPWFELYSLSGTYNLELYSLKDIGGK